LPNFACGTRVTVRTTIVLFIPLEITSPVRVLRVPRPSSFVLVLVLESVVSSAIKLFLLRRLRRSLRQYRLNSRHIPAQQPQPARLFELSALLLQAQVQTFLAHVALLRLQLFAAHFRYLFEFHVSLGHCHVVSRQKLRPHRQLIGRQPQ